MIKFCKYCLCDKPVEGFKKGRHQCRECRNAESCAWRAAHPENVYRYNKTRMENPAYRAKANLRTRNWEKRNPDRVNAAAKKSRNKPESKARRATYRVATADRHNEQRRARYAADPETARRKLLEYRAARPGLSARYKATRKAAELNATPSWANQSAIDVFYARAAALTVETGILHEVDHIVPLQGRFVCGLHVQDNLQVLTQSENRRKSNKMMVHV